MYNFDCRATLSIASFPPSPPRNPDWGLKPLTGSWFDPNATFGGVFGSVVNDEYDLGLSIWSPTMERSFWGDFTRREGGGGRTCGVPLLIDSDFFAIY